MGVLECLQVFLMLSVETGNLFIVFFLGSLHLIVDILDLVKNNSSVIGDFDDLLIDCIGLIDELIELRSLLLVHVVVFVTVVLELLYSVRKIFLEVDLVVLFFLDLLELFVELILKLGKLILVRGLKINVLFVKLVNLLVPLVQSSFVFLLGIAKNVIDDIDVIGDVGDVLGVIVGLVLDFLDLLVVRFDLFVQGINKGLVLGLCILDFLEVDLSLGDVLTSIPLQLADLILKSFDLVVAQLGISVKIILQLLENCFIALLLLKEICLFGLLLLIEVIDLIS